MTAHNDASIADQGLLGVRRRHRLPDPDPGPTRGGENGRLADAAWAFPLVGAGIGGIAARYFFVAQLVGLGDGPAALLAVSPASR